MRCNRSVRLIEIQYINENEMKMMTNNMFQNGKYIIIIKLITF